MGKINVLDSVIFNRIAAGEVVENPRSVVKELVENSIDAGADSIAVEIRAGGIEYISVSDNGKGIEKEDMPIAFLPHATSKIHTLKDLETIATLGFRGEALPSIASVADVEMISRTPENDLGYKVVLRDGKIVDEGECGTTFGTKTTVRNLFATIPARAKFLRKPQMEASAVTELMAKIILANPHRKFKYSIDGEVQFQSDGNGVQSAIYSVYGAEFLDNLAEISYSVPGITLSGLICKPDYTKHNRTYQTLIVNGRYIVNADISYCIQQCYSTYLMKRQFPAYVLYLELPTDMVDVNVHPNKLDVRFSGEKRLKGIIYNVIKEHVDTLAGTPVSFSPITTVFQPSVAVNAQADELSENVTKSDNVLAGIDKNHPRTEVPLRTSGTPRVAEESIVRTRLGDFVRNVSFDAPVANSLPLEGGRVPQVDAESCILSLFDDETPIRYAGKLFNTYLFVESGEYFYVIDQHAAHEKLLYDKLVQQVDSQALAVQDLLVPYIFDVSPTEKVQLLDALEQINACGFKIDPLHGCSFSLYALPVCCADIDLKKFVTLLMEDVGNIKSNSSFLKDRLMQAACKSAIKGEMDLSQNEIDSLLRQMQQSDAARFCPHGRPIVIRFTKYDVEKLFKRSL